MERIRIKIKFRPRTGHKDPYEVYSYTLTLSLASALDGGCWSTPRTVRFTPGNETRYPLCKRMGGAPGVVRTGAKNLGPDRDSIPGLYDILILNIR